MTVFHSADSQMLLPANNRTRNWSEAINLTIDELGWRSGTHIERLHDSVSVYMVEIIPEKTILFRPEGPATFSLSIFLDGAGTLSVEGATPFNIQAGSAVLFACNHTTRGENCIQSGNLLRFVDIRFEPSFLEILGDMSLARFGGAMMIEHGRPDQDVFMIGFPAPPELLVLANALLQCRFEQGPMRRLHFYCKAIEALSIGLDALGKLADVRPIRPLSPDEKRKLHLAMDRIRNDYSTDWTISRLAREVGLNERRLKEGFRSMVGQSVHAYLRETRLDAAAAYLTSGQSVTDVAYAVGFENLSHFSKIFKQSKGVLPSQYARLVAPG
jgi:AraC-like DNA-binding protein